MEKKAVIEKGKTPSIVSGNKSTFIKNGNAFTKGEEDQITDAEAKLEAAMASEYNKLKDV